MTFQKADLLKVAKLARLSLTDNEIERFQGDLKRIVDFVTELNQVDVSHVAPMSHAGDRVMELREDQAFEVLGEACVRSSAGFEGGLVKVPKIIE